MFATHRFHRRAPIRLMRPGAPPTAFTFLEIMFVVLIIGIMVAIVTPNLVGKKRKAQIATTKQQMDGLKTALQMYEMTHGEFPTTEQGLDALINRPSEVAEEDWEPCLDADAVPSDAWKNEFAYRCPGEHGRYYDLVSPGPDGEEGTEDDITNYTKKDSDNL